MENTITLNNQEKIKIRKAYGEYKAVKWEDDMPRSEYLEWCKEAIAYLRSQLPEELKDIENFSDLEPLIYSDNQVKFINEAQEQGLDIDYNYSGRAMYGDVCPSVEVEHSSDFKTTANYYTDSMGLDIVMYARY
jgi:hypothetical protein